MRALIGFILFCGLAGSIRAVDDAESAGLDAKQLEMLVRTYPNFLIRKREEQKRWVQELLTEGDYEKQYKMFDMAFTNILKMLEVEQEPVSKMQHTGELPNTPDAFKRVVTVLEHICIVGEIVLHFPDISYRIFEGHPKWKEYVGFGLAIANQYKPVFDQTTLDMLNLFDQEINPEKRTEDYINPYAAAAKERDEDAPPKAKKEKKTKKKKGPALQEL